MSSAKPSAFNDAVAQVYDRFMVPLIFEPYAAELATRLASMPVRRVLEIAAGTGVATRAMASALPADVSITATDLSPAMLARAEAVGTSRPVEWRMADAMALPFGDAEFDVVVCQFGAMFFPDRRKAFAEVRRVLGERGLFLFAVWDRIEENEIADTIENALESLFPDDPPRFMSRLPHGYFERETIAGDLAPPAVSPAQSSRRSRTSEELSSVEMCR